MARVDPSRDLVDRAGLGDDLLADLMEGPQQRLAEAGVLTFPSSRSLRSPIAFLALNSAREREYSAAHAVSISWRSLAERPSQTRLLTPRIWAAPGSWKPG